MSVTHPPSADHEAPRPLKVVGRILRCMSAPRRPLPSSPFNVQVAGPPLEQFAVNDRVTHDKYGLGSVTQIEPGVAVRVDFGEQQVRITSPYSQLEKL